MSDSIFERKKMSRCVCIIVRDGWGKNPFPEWNKANAVYLAKHPVADRIMAEYPSTLIHTSGFDVGLPEGTMGNSEVGHQNIGAGRVVDQESVKITKEIRTGAFEKNAEVNAAIDFATKNNSNLHLFGIVSDAGVHGLLEHLYGVLALCKKRGFSRVFLHAFTDGRDSPPSYGVKYLTQVEAKMMELGVGQIATVSGRYYAMDRDNRWPRVEKAFRAIVFGDGPKFSGAVEAVQNYYAHPTEPNMSGDEFVTPSVIATADGKMPRATVKENDAVIFYNYRGDRPREITKAFVMDDFKGFDRGPKLKLYYVTMTAYEEGLPVHVAYPKPPKMKNILGEFISAKGLGQFRCAETEKFPHVTFFFNDYREAPFPGEDRYMAASPKVSTYDQKPEMSAYEIAENTVKAIESEKVFADRRELRQRRHGRPHRRARSGDQGCRACGCLRRQTSRRAEESRRQRDRSGGSLATANEMIDPATGGTTHGAYHL